jgi:hypothetical protein
MILDLNKDMSLIVNNSLKIKENTYNVEYGKVVKKSKEKIEIRLLQIYLLEKTYITKKNNSLDNHFCYLYKDDNRFVIDMKPEENAYMYLHENNISLTYSLINDMLLEAMMQSKIPEEER